VLEAIYAVFTQGWSDPTGADPKSRGLVEEALFLGRLIAELLPAEPEPKGLLALMLYAHARRRARRDGEGRFVALDAQDASLWEGALIDEAEALMMSALPYGRVGRFQIEAAIQSAHVHRRMGVPTDWRAVVALYDSLLALTGSVVAALNRALALSRLEGPEAGIEALEAVSEDQRLADYQPYWAARADLCDRAGRRIEAEAAYMRAIGLESDPAVRVSLQDRLAAMTAGP
jgi:RNA polymerase sigma-70 factor (ECF subfamily)